MKKWMYALVSIIILIGIYLYFGYQNKPNVILVSGDQVSIEKINHAFKPKLASHTQYKEKLDDTSSTIHTKLRVLSKTTAEALIKENMLQIQTTGNDTDPIHSLPPITKETGIVYMSKNDSIQNIKVENDMIPVTKEKGQVSIGVGKEHETQEKLLIVDDSTYKNLPLKENTFSILRFSINATLSGGIPEHADIENNGTVSALLINANKR
ncbi:hypothetical protein BK708_25485 [Bacillus thuringiensis serovar yunnanensis]|nr:hypothetical protein BK708_25485 [Bacillus thuringiensis serovar yunnanensis]